MVYRHLFLMLKRTGNSPIFLGPTMIHHWKDFHTYEVLPSTCVAACKDLEKCRGYIRDGETTLEMAWKSDLPKATSLRCVKHFEGNSKRELHKIGIREKKSQKFFLDRVFGVQGKEEGLLTLRRKKKLSRNYNLFGVSLTRKMLKYFKKTPPISPSFQNT